MSTLERIPAQSSDTAALAPASASTIVPIQKNFNRGYFDLKDPLEDTGINVEPFDTSLIYSVDRSAHAKIVSELYDQVLHKVLQGAIPGADVKLVDFNDAMIRNEPPRRYIVIERETQRGTSMSLYTTFLTYGDSIYLRIAGFVFGPLSTTRLLVSILVSIVASILLFSTVLGICLIPFVWYFFFGTTIKLILRGNPPGLALRKAFNKGLNLGTFNLDDILIFFKYVNPQILSTIRDVLTDNDVEIKILEAIDQQIQNINYVTNISNSDGSIFNMVGTIIGGNKNKATVKAAK